ncbi:hypothetical protein WKT22_00534 [Candidatus Lokiarchaeum ossiferum]
METPFLEISVEHTLEKSMSIYEILSQISVAFEVLYKKDANIIEQGGIFCVRIDFDSTLDFEKIYEQPYSLYTFLFDNFINGNDEFEKLFSEDTSNQIPNKNGLEENYLVLRYRTNCIAPMRNYYGFTSHVNKIFGDKVINEEIVDGYLRFIQTKTDFKALLAPGDVETGWKKRFERRKVDLNHPLIQEFFEKVKEWNEKHK